MGKQRIAVPRIHNDSSAKHQTKHARASAAHSKRAPKASPNPGTPDTRSAQVSGSPDGGGLPDKTARTWPSS